MQNNNIDYANTYFRYRNPTKIIGEPTYKTLKKLKLELRANASSVDSNLGGGNHGYLGLVLTNAEYAAVPGITPRTTFVAPAC